MQVLKEAVRTAILKSARKEFEKNGLEKASMRVIASKAGMTVGNLYRYYSNKEDLFYAAIGSKKLTEELYRDDYRAFKILLAEKVSKKKLLESYLESVSLEKILEEVK